MTIPVSSVSNNQTFGAWLTTTNRLVDIVSQNTVTADSSNGGSVTTGNSFVNGHFGSLYVYVANTLSGGNVSSGGVLRILANVAITNGTSNLVSITANSTQSNVQITANNVVFVPSGNVTVGGNTLVVNTANVLFSGANIQFTNSPLSGNITFTSNTIYSGSVIIANGSFGANGAVLYSNGTGMYWEVIPAVVGNNGIIANADGIFVNANNGLVANSTGVFVNSNNGIVANATGVYVLQGTGAVVNATGVHVNTAYIATLTANSATFANSSATNTFTVGNGSFFVANGNFGIGNSAPVHKLRVNGDISLSGGIHANGAFGTNGQFLTSNGTVSYWSNQVYPANGIAVSTGTAWTTSKTSPSGDIVGTTDTQSLTGKTFGNYTETVFTITDGATVNLDPNNGPIQTWTLGANRTPGQANWAAGQSITLMIDDGSAATITWTTLAVVWKTDGGFAPTLQTTGFTVIVLWKVGTTIYGARVGDA
jgi:hypothetical protein